MHHLMREKSQQSTVECNLKVDHQSLANGFLETTYFTNSALTNHVCFLLCFLYSHISTCYRLDTRSQISLFGQSNFALVAMFLPRIKYGAVVFPSLVVNYSVIKFSFNYNIPIRKIYFKEVLF